MTASKILSILGRGSCVFKQTQSSANMRNTTTGNYKKH